MALRKRIVGLLGYGAINQKVHRFLSGFDVEFVILRRSWEGKHESLPTPVRKFRTDQLHAFLTATDTLIVAVPLTAETRGMLGFEELKLLGPDGVLVNVARGEVIQQEALYQSLAQGVIAGAAIDVWYTYQPEPDEAGRKYPFNFPFQQLDNLVMSPHRGASPMENLQRWDEVVENLYRFVQGRRDLLNIVNLDRGY